MEFILVDNRYRLIISRLHYTLSTYVAQVPFHDPYIHFFEIDNF